MVSLESVLAQSSSIVEPIILEDLHQLIGREVVVCEKVIWKDFLLGGDQVNEIQYGCCGCSNSFLICRMILPNSIPLIEVKRDKLTQGSAHAPSFESKPNRFVHYGLFEAVLPKILDHGFIMGEVLFWLKHFNELFLEMSDDQPYFPILVNIHLKL